MLYTSGFVDDVTFSHSRANGLESTTTCCFVEFAKWPHREWSCCLRLQAY